MTLYAQITNGAVTQVAPAPTQPGYGPDGHWHDYTKPAEVTAYLTDGGWLPVTETSRPADTTTHYQRAVYTTTGQTVTQSWEAVAKSPETIRAEAEQAARQRLHDDLTAGIAGLVTARKAAKQDRAAAASVQTQAAALATQLGTRATADAAWVPKATYTAADLITIRGEIVYLLQTMKAVVEAVGSNAAWRKAVDDNAILTDNAILWLAKNAVDDPLAAED